MTYDYTFTFEYKGSKFIVGFNRIVDTNNFTIEFFPTDGDIYTMTNKGRIDILLSRVWEIVWDFLLVVDWVDDFIFVFPINENWNHNKRKNVFSLFIRNVISKFFIDNIVDDIIEYENSVVVKCNEKTNEKLYFDISCGDPNRMLFLNSDNDDKLLK